MKRTTLVFSLVREQSIFMTIMISALTFLSVLAFGIALSVGSGIVKWNNQWDKFATIQTTNKENQNFVKTVISNNKDKIESVHEISQTEMEHMMKPWISNGTKITEYLPQMIELKVKKAEHINDIQKQISTKARFLTHTAALQTSISAGWKLVTITTFILILILLSIGICISYISKNIAMLHKHELEILNQVGASDKFIARQMQIIVGKISTTACFIGFCFAIPIILMILSTARSARVGLMATMSLSLNDWFYLFMLTVLIIIFSVYITKKTTLKMLSER